MINALILIPEITKGMKSIGSKSLLRIKNSKHIIEYQIEQIRDIHKNICINIATGFDNDKIKKIIDKYDVNIAYNDSYEDSNYGKSLRIFLEQNPDLDNLFIVGSGILFKKDAILYQNLKEESKIFVLDKPKNNFNIGCGSGEYIEYLFYDLVQPWSECVFLNQNAIDAIKLLIKNKNVDQMYIFEIINHLIMHNIVFKKYSTSKNHFFKISGLKDLNKAKIFI